MLKHYETAPAPARSLRPTDKSKVEVGVQIARRWMLFRLRDRVFFSIEELNEALPELTEQLNAHPIRKMAGCRRQRFEDDERSQLKPLPGDQLELFDWRYDVRVSNDHHVEHARCLYSVPRRLAGQWAVLRFTASMLEARATAQGALVADQKT